MNFRHRLEGSHPPVQGVAAAADQRRMQYPAHGEVRVRGRRAQGVQVQRRGRKVDLRVEKGGQSDFDALNPFVSSVMHQVFAF